MKLLGILVCFLCVSFLMASETYKAGVLRLQNKYISDYTPFIYEASETGIDILVLPPPKPSSVDNYDEILKSLSNAAKQAGLYVVAHLYEKTRCQVGYETVRSNLVFDRTGSIVAVYRKPLAGVANCTTSNPNLVTFTTDFGVTFGVLMEEDLILSDVKHMTSVQNFVMTGDWHSDVPFLNAAQFAPTWSYVTNANLVSTAGIYSGKGGLKTGSDKLAIAELQKNGKNDQPTVPSVDPATLNFPVEDLSQYVLSPLNLDASVNGYQDSICHRGFCCEFYVKTARGSKQDVSYSLATFNGIRQTGHHNIGVQICALFTCTGINHKSCEMRSESKTSNIMFERISIAANFTKPNAQYPIVHSTATVPTEKFKFNTKTDGISQQVTLQMVDTQNVVNLGIFGMKDMEKNYISSEKNSTESLRNEFFEYIFNEDVQEFFDYVWIRVRILIVVVSVYVLEMM